MPNHPLIQFDIADDVKMGREYALLGNYDTSLVYYEGACQALKKKVSNIRSQAAANSCDADSRARSTTKHSQLSTLVPRAADRHLLRIPKAKVVRGMLTHSPSYRLILVTCWVNPSA